MGCARITRVHPTSSATAMANAQPRKHRESVLTIWFIVSPATPPAGQARHVGKYSRGIDGVPRARPPQLA